VHASSFRAEISTGWASSYDLRNLHWVYKFGALLATEDWEPRVLHYKWSSRLEIVVYLRSIESKSFLIPSNSWCLLSETSNSAQLLRQCALSYDQWHVRTQTTAYPLESYVDKPLLALFHTVAAKMSRSFCCCSLCSMKEISGTVKHYAIVPQISTTQNVFPALYVWNNPGAHYRFR